MFHLLILIINGIDCQEPAHLTHLRGTGLNLVISSPLGGSERPAGFIRREAGCWNDTSQACIWSHTCGTRNPTKCTTKKLAYTGIDIVGEALHQELCELAGMCPTTVISNLHRSVIDLNKDMEEATFGVPVAEIAWSEFHAVIGEAVEEMSEGGLYLDLLGHSHSYNWTELGYLVSGDELDNASFTFNPNITSIRHLVVANNDEDVVRGQSSLGGMLTAEGYSSVPSPHHPGPGGERYFYGSGSYNIKRYSSLTGGKVDGIQVAVPGYYRKSDLARPPYVRALAKAVLNFLRMYYPEPMPVTDEPDSESTGRAARNRQPKQFYMMLTIALLLVV